MGEERKVINGAVRNNDISVQTQEGRWQGLIRIGQANAYPNSNTELKREVKSENAPPGLTYGGVDQRRIEQGEGNDPTDKAI